MNLGKTASLMSSKGKVQRQVRCKNKGAGMFLSTPACTSTVTPTCNFAAVFSFMYYIMSVMLYLLCYVSACNKFKLFCVNTLVHCCVAVYLNLQHTDMRFKSSFLFPRLILYTMDTVTCWYSVYSEPSTLMFYHHVSFLELQVTIFGKEAGVIR